ncbi:PREDICTED: baculoviral IAP repeat-containing protein 7-like isoform X2 [Dinoponera quadriceps]|uniref:Baculoviral IAP repeat-containing protein 7-like isoform X2 n=1 Tax=Dinoponera quadriceps TaxID=609295 RepID=A0A6P3YF20_DINQU|nr:PREDICTED: baculoviral IAP repeat-containing protein 7-like isoform X2 [Dinoponera quadriceps]
MNIEENRLKTFEEWPANAAVDAARIAKAGFYYTGQGLEVQCFLCGTTITDWNYGDQAMARHRLAQPACPFVVNPVDTCNIPLVPASASDVTVPSVTSSSPVTRHSNVVKGKPEALELANVTLVSGATTGMTDLGIQVHTAPSNPKNTTYEDRLRTFVGWPTDHKQTPEMLSASGFYYTGTQDQVRCFHCDGGLRNWEPIDDVWFEHARWFPTCTFVNLVRGPEFVKHCIDNRPPLDPKILGETPDEEGEDVLETLAATSLPTVPQSAQSLRVITDSVIAKLLDTAPVLSALEIGLSVDRVKRTLKKRMEEYGVTYTSAEELIQDVLNDQTMEDYNSGASDSSFSESVTSVDRVVAQIAHEATSTSNDTEKPDVCSEMNDLDDKDEDNEGEERETGAAKSGASKDKERKADVVDKQDELEGKKADKSDNITLQEENRKLKEARLCKICMDNDVSIVFLPCGHLATCIFCASSLTFCPMCRIMIRASVRTFLS